MLKILSATLAILCFILALAAIWTSTATLSAALGLTAALTFMGAVVLLAAYDISRTF